MSLQLAVEKKTEVLLEALPYIQRFRGSVFVVKFGGSFMDTEQAKVGVATDLAFLSAVGIHVVVVHGGGPAINQAMAEASLEPVFKNGLRVTDGEAVKIVEKTLNRVINLGICENIQLKRGKPLGVYGQRVFQCERLSEDAEGKPVDIGFVGKITQVDKEPVTKAIREGYIPIVSPVGQDKNGQFYNINADTAASHLAAAVGARRLVFLCDVPGLLKDPKNPQSLISTLAKQEVPNLKETGVIGSGMLPKVESAVMALENGVHRVHFIDGRLNHSLLLEIFTDKGIGTEIVH